MAAPSTIASFFLDPGKPDVPEWENIEITDIVRDTAHANLRNFGKLEKLTGKLNAFNVEQDLSTLESLFPGASKIIEQSSELIQSQLRGELPEDVERMIRQLGAEAGVAGGTGDSEFTKFRTARDLGLTSLDMTQRGLSSAERWLAQSRARVPLFNMASMFATNAQTGNLAVINAENKFNRDWMEEQVDHSLSMFEQSIMNSMQQMDQLILQGSSMAMGSAMGGGGGMGGMGGGGGGGAPTVNLSQPYNFGGGTPGGMYPSYTSPQGWM